MAITALEPGGDVVGLDSPFRDFAPLHSIVQVDGRFSVFRLAGASGTPLWRQDVFGTGPDSAGAAFALDVDTDVVAAGVLHSVTTPGEFAVVKLSLETGTEIWRYALADGAAMGVAHDANGDVLVVGTLGGAFAVIKLAGTTGAELWRYAAPSAGGVADTVAVTPTGDVVAGGSVPKHPTALVPSSDFTVLKLAGATGAEQWRRITPHGNASALKLDPFGDAVAVGTLTPRAYDYRFTVSRVDGATGRRRFSRTVGRFADGVDVVADDAGNPIAVGFTTGVLASGARGGTFTVAKLCRKNGRSKDTQHCPL
jgi:hypothetical protein